MNIYDSATFTLLSPEFFASLEERTPGPEFATVVSEVLDGDGWKMLQQGVWTHMHPPVWHGSQQGWKLHVSATPANAPTVIRRVTEVLREHQVAFKFASDRRMLFIMLSKNWPREGAGKFITVYPHGEDQFRQIGKALAAATEGLDGPYILSDRRVPGSRVVFYRYGQHLPRQTLDARGHRVQQMITPDGAPVADDRRSFYQQPEWVNDPFAPRPVTLDPAKKKIRLNGRYEVQKPLKFSNTGGVYLARDLERNGPVIVREARPCTGWIDEATDSVALLRKEARILQRMDGSGLAPAFVEQFQAWEHQFLAQEEVEGALLRDFILSRYLKRSKVASPRHLFVTFRRLILEILRGIEAFHAEGIILRDLSANNVLVRRDGTVCFIDFEFAWEREGPDAPASRIHTPGFASPEQMAGRPPTEGDDLYSLGALVVEMCSLMAGGLGLNRGGVLSTAELMMDEIGLPGELVQVGRGLLEPDPAVRWTGDAVRDALADIRASVVPWRAAEPGRAVQRPTEFTDSAAQLEARIKEACEAVCAFFEASADPARKDRLWPASPQAYHTNAVGIQVGACGPIEYVRRMRGTCPGAWLDWLESMAISERCPPGLYVGLAGAAVTLAACGRGGAARRILLDAAKSPLLDTEADLYHGAAGVGTAALVVGSALDDPELVDLAERTGELLLGRSEPRRYGIAWRGSDGTIPCGLAQGGSGIALFYTYLGARTGNPRHWETARAALDFEFSQVKWRSGYAFWPATGGSRRRRAHSPHVFFGSAGVAAAALRLHLCTGEPDLLEWAELGAATTAFRWTNKLWQDYGYAGYGETFLDMHAATGHARHRSHALRMAQVLLPNQVATRYGTAFPGGSLNRVASDFGMGASGIAMFLLRVMRPDQGRAFFPDWLLPGWQPDAKPQPPNLRAFVPLDRSTD